MDRVQLWTAHVSACADEVAELSRLLDAEERARAGRFHFDADRTRYAVSHGLLRTVLGHALGAPPSSLRFGHLAHGKPYLLGADVPLQFNMSHSGDVVAIAVAVGRSLGVDVEQWADVEYDELSETFFSDAELRALRRLEPHEKAAGFFTCWTRKEAYIKATGVGVSYGLDYFDVSLTPGVPPRLLADRLTGSSWRDWSMYEIPAPPGYSAALVVEGAEGTFEQPTLHSLTPCTFIAHCQTDPFPRASSSSPRGMAATRGG